MMCTSGIRNSSSLHPLFVRCFSYPVTEFRLQALGKKHTVGLLLTLALLPSPKVNRKSAGARIYT